MTAHVPHERSLPCTKRAAGVKKVTTALKSDAANDFCRLPRKRRHFLIFSQDSLPGVRARR